MSELCAPSTARETADSAYVVYRCGREVKYEVEVALLGEGVMRLVVKDAEKNKVYGADVKREKVFQFVLSKTREKALAWYVDVVADRLAGGGGGGGPEVEVEHAVYPLGLSDVYYFLSDGGWRKIELQGASIFADAAEVEAPKWIVKNMPHAVYHLPPGDASLYKMDIIYETDELLRELRDVIYAYVSMVKKYLDVSATWTLLTYARHAFRYAEYLRIHKAGFGSGGSTAAKVVTMLSARGIKPLIDPSPASAVRLFHSVKGTVNVDEVRGELPEERVELLRLLVEGAFDVDNLTARVENGEVVLYSLYSNLVVVDTGLRYTSLSAERRAWTIRLTRDASRMTNLDAALEDAKKLAPRLYAWGLVFPIAARRYVEMHRHVQGLGALMALRDFLRASDPAIADSAYETVREQLEHAFATAVATDPIRRVLDAVQQLVEDAVQQIEQRAGQRIGPGVDVPPSAVPEPWMYDGGC
ncbi:hypothetical protein, partial [Pyrobaculum sp.]|uniref:hypothetical protein n=1 Tax=Pyrobaculum sp. TaxID=2004705 RepID=UPI003D0F4F0D